MPGRALHRHPRRAHPREGGLILKLGNDLGTEGFSFRMAPCGDRIILVSGAWPSWAPPVCWLLRWPRQCRYSMCHTLEFPCTSCLRLRFTMLRSITDNPCLSLARCRIIFSSTSSGSRLQVTAFLLVPPFFWRLTGGVTGWPGMYPSGTVFLFFCSRDEGALSDALLDLEVLAAVLIGFAEEHAEGVYGMSV